MRRLGSAVALDLSFLGRSEGVEHMRKILLGFFELCIHIVIYALVIFLVYRAAVFAYDFSYNVFGDPVMSKYDYTGSDRGSG